MDTCMDCPYYDECEDKNNYNKREECFDEMNYEYEESPFLSLDNWDEMSYNKYCENSLEYQPTEYDLYDENSYYEKKLIQEWVEDEDDEDCDDEENQERKL